LRASHWLAGNGGEIGANRADDGGAHREEQDVKHAKSSRGISRVDSDVSHTHAWLVTIQRRGVIYRKRFSDGVYGSRAQSFAAAQRYRDELIAQHPPLSPREYSSILKKNNRSGVVGVGRYCSFETRNLPEDKQRWFWLAAWSLPGGRRKRMKFSVNRYGEEKAFKMALQARREALAKLEGRFEPSAARRLSKPRAKRRAGTQTGR
jgi:hypothetical protein